MQEKQKETRTSRTFNERALSVACTVGSLTGVAVFGVNSIITVIGSMGAFTMLLGNPYNGWLLAVTAGSAVTGITGICISDKCDEIRVKLGNAPRSLSQKGPPMA